MKKPLTTTTTAVACLAVSALGDEPPARIMVFATGGKVATRDGRSYHIDLARLAARFAADGVKIPIDVNHATEILAPQGKRADPVGWVTGLEVEGPALFGAVEWIDPAGALALLRAYPYVSPAFPHRDGDAQWIKSVALVSSPALGNQPALAAATDTETEEPLMKTVITALGLADGATEAECLAAVTALQGATKDVVPKAIHDEAITKLAATATELATLKATGRQAKVDAVIEGALTAKKILPVHRDHYVALCATDDGLAAVEKLLAASPALLGASGLDDKKVPDTDGVVTLSADELAVIEQLGITEEAYREANGLKKP